MKNVNLTETEEYAFQATKRCVEGHLNVRRLAVELNATVRTARSYIAGFKKEGRGYFVHGNRGRPSPRRIPDGTRDVVVKLFTGKYNGATYSHFAELLAVNEKLSFSEAFVRGLLRSRFFLSPKATKRTRRAVRHELSLLKKQPSAVIAPSALELAARLLTAAEAHPSRSRCKYFGELLQTDASDHVWFGAEITSLHIAVDDATSRVLGAYFDRQETLNGYFVMSSQVFTRYGVPACFLADRRTVFTYPKKSEEGSDRPTQFGYMCKNLGIEIRTTSVAQAKGRVERMWSTLQQRLPIEMRLAGVTTIEQANAFLPAFLEALNEQFGLPIPSESVFIPSPPAAELRLHLSVLTERTVDNGAALRYDNKTFRTVNAHGDPVYLAKGTVGAVAKTLDGALFFTVESQTFALEQIPDRAPFSKNFDPLPMPTPRKVYIPQKNHPWRLPNFRAFVEKLKKKPQSLQTAEGFS